jgi:nitrite reductase/ring-hydroxylating ferredoxin subunit
MSKVNGNDGHYVFAASLFDIQNAVGQCLSVPIQRHIVALFYRNSKVYAIDNRCPHMGFPLIQGTVKDAILTCHWHHARFDLNGGGTFDQWAGDVRSFPVKIRNKNEVWVSISSLSSVDVTSHYQMLLCSGLKQNLRLTIAKAVIALLDECETGSNKNESKLVNVFRIGLDFGTHYKQSGWGQGLTVLTCMMNMTPYLDIEDRAHALYQGLCAVAEDCVSMPPRFEITPLPGPWPDLVTLKRWFRQFIESRDGQSAERCIATAIKLGVNIQQIADMLFAAATDHRFLDIGHTLDFTNKALEAIDKLDWDHDRILIESILTSLVTGYASAERMEESSSWRYPIDLVAILEGAFSKLPVALKKGKAVRLTDQQEETTNYVDDKSKKAHRKRSNTIIDVDALVTVLLGDNPQSIIDVLLSALEQGTTKWELASIVCYASALRIVQFHTRNEFSDWDAILHTFTFANALHQGLRRIPTTELLRGVFDAAIRVYLNRFLNIPSATIPKGSTYDNINNDGINRSPKTIWCRLSDLLDKQQRVNEASEMVADYLYRGGDPDQLISILVKLLLREDRNFHSIQMLEAASRQYSLLDEENNDNISTNSIARVNFLLAISRYLAAHSPTMRSQIRTYQIANQLYRGEQLF